VFRELGYGVCFYLSAMLGAIVGVIVFSGHTRHPALATEWLIEGTIAGAMAGSVAWLWAKYSLWPVWYYGLVLAVSMAAGAAMVNLIQSPGDRFIHPFIGAAAGGLLWFTFSPFFVRFKR
jgi:hypothetical protein